MRSIIYLGLLVVSLTTTTYALSTERFDVYGKLAWEYRKLDKYKGLENSSHSIGPELRLGARYNISEKWKASALFDIDHIFGFEEDLEDDIAGTTMYKHSDEGIEHLYLSYYNGSFGMRIGQFPYAYRTNREYNWVTRKELRPPGPEYVQSAWMFETARGVEFSYSFQERDDFWKGAYVHFGIHNDSHDYDLRTYKPVGDYDTNPYPFLLLGYEVGNWQFEAWMLQTVNRSKGCVTIPTLNLKYESMYFTWESTLSNPNYRHVPDDVGYYSSQTTKSDLSPALQALYPFRVVIKGGDIYYWSNYFNITAYTNDNAFCKQIRLIPEIMFLGREVDGFIHLPNNVKTPQGRLRSSTFFKSIEASVSVAFDFAKNITITPWYQVSTPQRDFAYRHVYGVGATILF